MAAEQVSEQEIQLRKRARRRLIGAIALVLLMITVLPMVLDERETQSPQPEIAVSIPSQDGGDFASKIVPVAPSPEAAPPSDMRLAAPLEKSQPVAVPEKVQPPQAVPAKPEKVDTAAPTEAAAAPAEKPAAAEKPAVGSGGFAVQIGVYSDAANIQQLEDKLAAKGFKSYTEKLDTPKGAKIRLRAGPFATRVEAEKARDALKVAGMAGIVVAE